MAVIELQPDAEVHVIVRGAVVSTFAYFRADENTASVAVGIDDVARRGHYTWLLRRAIDALRAAQFSNMPLSNASALDGKSGSGIDEEEPPF